MLLFFVTIYEASAPATDAAGLEGEASPPFALSAYRSISTMV